MSQFSALGVGWPSIGTLAAAASLAIVAYVLAFGDILVLEALIDDANKARPDEKIRFNVSRNHIITAIRNIGEGIAMPLWEVDPDAEQPEQPWRYAIE